MDFDANGRTAVNKPKARLLLYEILGIAMVCSSVLFFWYSVGFMTEKDYIAAILQIFIGFSLVRGGLEMTKIALVSKDRP